MHHSGSLQRLFVALGGAYTAFMKRIDCVCGHVVEAEDDDELWADAQEHLRTDHPDLVGKVSREDILAQAEET
jgi:predicted small metal-binding protein